MAIHFHMLRDLNKKWGILLILEPVFASNYHWTTFFGLDGRTH